MKYKPLGRTGVKVSELCLGTMMFGGKTDKDETFRIIDYSLDQGVNFVDTANVYAGTKSESLCGEALEIGGKRKNTILATKVFFAQSEDRNARGLSRRHVIEACEDSLRRLRTDWIDLYQLHRACAEIPIDETLRAMDDLITAGKVRYVGSSMFPSWQIVEALWVSKELGLNRFISEQPAYHLLDRTIEREVVPACQSFGMAVLPWGPLCGGLLSGKYAQGGKDDPDWRWQNGVDNHNRAVTPQAWEVLGKLRELSVAKGCSMSQYALAWCGAQPGVTSPIIGPKTFAQVEDNLAAVNVEMTEEDMGQVDELVPPSGYVLRYYDGAGWADLRPHKERSIV